MADGGINVTNIWAVLIADPTLDQGAARSSNER